MTAIVLGMLLASTSPRCAASLKEPVAIAYGVLGPAAATPARNRPEPIHARTRFQCGTRIEVREGGQLRIAFSSGKRYELLGPSSATVSDSGLGSTSGVVHELPPVFPLAHLQPLSDPEDVGPTGGVIVVRNNGPSWLYPHKESTVLANSAVLRCSPVNGAEAYDFEVTDELGNRVVKDRAPEPKLALAAGTLEPGRRYSWSVEGTDRLGNRFKGSEVILTLAADAAESRVAAASTLGDDPFAARLRAEFDLSLGLRWEAREAFRAIPKDAPDPR
jgi:hypothetical protein